MLSVLCGFRLFIWFMWFHWKFQTRFLQMFLNLPDITAQVKLSEDSANTSPSFKMRKRSSKSSLPHVVNSSRSSLHFPIISGLVDKQNLEIGNFIYYSFNYKRIWILNNSICLVLIEEYGTLRDGSLQSCYSSNNSLDRAWSPTTQKSDDLYSWMAKQHKSRKESVSKENAESIIVSIRIIIQTYFKPHLNMANFF